jgi:uncharacterized protein DUF3126
LIARTGACYCAFTFSFQQTSHFGSFPLGSRTVDVQEVKKLDAYLKKLFGNARIRVVPRPKKDDSAEVYVGDEFVGVLFVDDEDDERSYNFQMAILGSDLE